MNITMDKFRIKEHKCLKASILIYKMGSKYSLNNNGSSFIPAIVYNNADTDKLRILTDNKSKAGIYLWTHIESGKNM